MCTTYPYPKNLGVYRCVRTDVSLSAHLEILTHLTCAVISRFPGSKCGVKLNARHLN